MRPYVQRRVKLEFNEFSKAAPSANDLYKSGEYLDMNILFRIQSNSIPKRRDQTPTSAFALIPPSLELAEQVSASSSTYACGGEFKLALLSAYAIAASDMGKAILTSFETPNRQTCGMPQLVPELPIHSRRDVLRWRIHEGGHAYGLLH
jgi:hypothetical protein